MSIRHRGEESWIFGLHAQTMGQPVGVLHHHLMLARHMRGKRAYFRSECLLQGKLSSIHLIVINGIEYTDNFSIRHGGARHRSLD